MLGQTAVPIVMTVSRRVDYKEIAFEQVFYNLLNAFSLGALRNNEMISCLFDSICSLDNMANYFFSR